MASSPGSGKGSANRGGKGPATPDDMRLRIKHTEDSIAYNQRHAKDHAKAMSEAKVQLKQTKAQLKRATGKGK